MFHGLQPSAWDVLQWLLFCPIFHFALELGTSVEMRVDFCWPDELLLCVAHSPLGYPQAG